MDTNTTDKIDEQDDYAALLEAHGLAHEDALALDGLSLRRDSAREQLAALDAEYRAHLPVATAEQFAMVRAMVRNETALPEGADRMNVDFKLDEKQIVDLKAAHAERRLECIAAKDQTVTGILRDEAQKLVSVKVRVGAKKTTSTLRFEKSHGGQARGLIAAIRAAKK